MKTCMPSAGFSKLASEYSGKQKLWNSNYAKILRHILSHYAHVNYFGSVLIKMNVRTRTLTLYVHFPKYCELITWTCSFCRPHKSFWIISFEGTYLNFWIDLWSYVSLSVQNLCCSQNNLSAFLSTQHSLMHILNLRTSIFHSSAAFKAQIFM
jgi:hypothetical protein